MSKIKKCTVCGYKFKRNDSAICPECFTSREESINCGDLSSDLHSHKKWGSSTFLGEEKSDFLKELESERSSIYNEDVSFTQPYTTNKPTTMAYDRKYNRHYNGGQTRTNQTYPQKPLAGNQYNTKNNTNQDYPQQSQVGSQYNNKNNTNQTYPQQSTVNNQNSNVQNNQMPEINRVKLSNMHAQNRAKQANLYPTKPMYRQPTYNSPTYTGRYSSTNNKSSVGTVITIITIVIIFITTLLSSYLGSKHERSIRLEDNENYSQIINDIIGGNSNYNHFEHFYEIYWQFDETFDLNEASITVNSVNMLELSDISDYLYYEDVIDTDLSYFGDWKFVSIPITVENNGEDDIYISDIILNLSCPVIPELYDNENIYSTDEDIVNIIPLNNLELTDIIPVGGSLTFDVIYALPKADIYTFYLQYGINLPYRFDFACFY